MQDSIFISNYLEQYFDELQPKEFYRALFPKGELASHNERNVKGKYNAIAVELLPQTDNKKNNAKRYILTDELDQLDKLLESKNFIIISPISYAGRSREAAAARFIYGIAIDLDGIESEQNITDLFYQIENKVLPKPTYIVWSGSGVHLYYMFKQPIPCFKNITKQLANLKQGLTLNIWNRYITKYYDKPQVQSLFQGFRIVGNLTKSKQNRTRAFEIGERVDIEYLNNFVAEKYKVKDFTYKSKLTLSQAANKFPEWYEKRIVQQLPKGVWICKEDLYRWWQRRILEEAKAGHRYYCCMVLAIYAKKCGIDRKTLEQDAFALIEPMEKLTTEENNHFTREDILAALELYNDSYITFPIDTITQLTNLPIEKNKRNYLPQKIHLEAARNKKEVLKKHGLMKKEGRPSKQKAVLEWQQEHPNGTKAECIKELAISKPTVYKHWKEDI